MKETIQDVVVEVEIPKYLHGIHLIHDWCMYNGEVFYAVWNYDESEKRGKCVLDLAYCATKASNGIFLKQRIWNAKRFKPWEGHSMWSLITSLHP